MSKEFDIDGSMLGVPTEMVDDGFWEAAIDFFEANDWSFGGGLEADRIAGCISASDETVTSSEISTLLINWAAQHGWTFEGSIREFKDHDD